MDARSSQGKLDKWNSGDPQGIRARGFRMLHLGGSEFEWTNPSLIPDLIARGAIDCTDMEDDAFCEYVFAHQVNDYDAATQPSGATP